MKKKIKVNRRIKPINDVSGYFRTEDEFMNFGSQDLETNRVVTTAYTYQDRKQDFREELQSKSPFTSPNFPVKSKRLKQVSRKRQIKFLRFIGHFGIIVGCMYQCFSFLSIYFKYPTTVELNVANEAILDFPAVTVCNNNPVKYKLWCNEDKLLCKRKQNETIEGYRVRQGNEYDHLEKKRRIDLGYSLKEFVILAEYEDKPVVDTFQWYYDYEFTNCYTFNAAWGNRKGPLASAIVFNPVTGKSSELVLCVNMDLENYSNITGRVVGRTRMTIHANDIIPNPSYDSASLEAGSIYSYGIQKVTTRLLKSPYQTKCRNYEEEKEYRTGARMSQKNCLLECFKTETEKMCGCTYRRLAIMYDAIPCEMQSQYILNNYIYASSENCSARIIITCIYDCLANEEDRVFNMCNPQCPMACQKIEFQYVATDSEPLRQESALYDKMPIKELFATQEEVIQNLACISIHYGSTETRTMSHRPKYAFVELFSLLGGYSGLWLGFSLLNGYEIVLIKLTQQFLKRKLQKKRKIKVTCKRRKYY